MPNDITCTVIPTQKAKAVFVFVKCPHCGVMKHPKGIPRHQKRCKELQEEAKNSHDGKVGCKYCEERFHPSEVSKHLPHCKMRQQKNSSKHKKSTTSSTTPTKTSTSTSLEKTKSPKAPPSKGTTTMMASLSRVPTRATMAAIAA